MPENKEKIEKEVMEELEKKGVKANKEVIQGLSDLAMEGISSGMSRTAAVTLSVGGAAAMALLSGGAAWFATKKVKDKEVADAQARAKGFEQTLKSVAPKDIKYFDDKNNEVDPGVATKFGVPITTGPGDSATTTMNYTPINRS